MDTCQELIRDHEAGIMRVARLLESAAGYVSGSALTAAFRLLPDDM